MSSALSEKLRRKSVRFETRAIKPLKNFILNNEITVTSAEKAYNDALSTLNRALDDVRKSNDPALVVEGITIDSPASPVSIDAESAAKTVSIVQDAFDSEIKRKIFDSIMGPHPVILSSLKVPSISYNAAKTAIEINQFERQILKEILTKGLSDIAKKDPKGLFKISKDISRQDSDVINEQIESLVYLNKVCTLAASGLDVTSLSDQIMQRASDALGSIITPSERSNSLLPKSLDEYITLTFPKQLQGSEFQFTNTSKLIILMQDMLLTSLAVHPRLIKLFSRKASSSESLFSTPGRFGYDLDGLGNIPEVNIPTCTDLMSQNETPIISQFIASKRTSQTRTNLGVLNNGSIETQVEAWDVISHLLVCISNEMILSAGIGRLVGSQLGNRFLDRIPDNQLQFRPFDKILGFSPTATPSEISSFFKTGPDKKGSYLDYLSLGEETVNREFVVMPFETKTVVDSDGHPFVSGKKYFIDLAIQADPNSEVEQRGAIKRFSREFKQFNSDMSSYLSEILAVDTETKLAPQFLLARIFQDISSVARSLDKDADQVDAKSAIVSSLVAISGFEPNIRVEVTNSASSRSEIVFSDILKASVVKALNDFDSLTGDSSYSLSNTRTAYSVNVDPDENFELNLRKSILALINRFRPHRTIRPNIYVEPLTNVSYQFNENEFLHDATFTSDSNLINLIARSIREIQKESLNLAQRNGAKSDYRNSNKRTYHSDCDDDRLIDIVCNLYSRIAYLTLPVLVAKETTDTRVTRARAYYGRGSARVSSILLEDIIRSLISGSPINAETIRQKLSIDPETTISAVGNNTVVSKVADVIDFSSKMPWHRYYIKSSLKILETVASGVGAASASVVNLFDILNGSVKRESLKGHDVTLYDMFVTNKRIYSEVLRNFDEHQANLITASKYYTSSAEDIYLRRDIDVSASERAALRVFLREIFDKKSLDDLHVISVGIPARLLESLYAPTISLRGSDSEIARRALNVSSGNTVRIEIDRYDEVHVNDVASGELDIFGDSSDYEFDPEIFILPDSITYNPDKTDPNAINEFDAVLRSTTFFRISGGKIIEQISGANLPTGKANLFMNCLRSYLLDLYSYETVRIRYLDGLGLTGSSSLTQPAYDMLKIVSQDLVLSKLLCSKVGFIDIFNNVSRSIKTDYELKDILTPDAATEISKFSMTDIRIASLISAMSPLTSKTGIISNRPFERIYNFLYDESLARLNISGDDSDRTRDRAKFDIYTLTARVVSGGK